MLLLSAIDRYHIVSQFKQRERVVIIDPARDPEAVNPNSGESQRDFDHPAQRCRVSGYAGSKVQPIVSTLSEISAKVFLLLNDWGGETIRSIMQPKRENQPTFFDLAV